MKYFIASFALSLFLYKCQRDSFFPPSPGSGVNIDFLSKVHLDLMKVSTSRIYATSTMVWFLSRLWEMKVFGLRINQ